MKKKESQQSTYIICGCRRSGTTLLAAILSSNEKTNPLGQEAQIITQLMSVYQWSINNFNDFGTSFFKDLDSFAHSYRKILLDLIADMTSFSSPNGILVLKNPELSMSISNIAMLLPEACLLATIRDPRDQICSEFEVMKRRKKYGRIEPILDQRNVTQLSRNYLTYTSGFLGLQKKSPNHILVIKYEDLILKTNQTIDKIQQYTNLQFMFEKNNQWTRVSDKASLHEGFSQSNLYGQPISKTPVGRYKKELTMHEIDQINVICGEVMQQFGYLE